MRRFALVISPVALALLGACATSDPVTPAPAPVVVAPAPVVTAPVVTAPPATIVTAPTVVAAIRAGHGRVESMTALQSAAAGGATMRRIGIKMDDGTVQYVDTPAQGLSIGERVELTADGQIRH